MVTTAANAVTEDISRNSCENQGFDNTYFLINKNNFSSVSVFYQEIPTINLAGGDYFKSLIGQRNRVSTYYDFDDLELLNANKELVSILDDDLPDYFIEREQVNYIDIQTTPVNINKFEVKNYNRKISPLDKHPLFSRIKRKERPILIDHLSTISKEVPGSISESLRIKSLENVHFTVLYGVSYGAITLSRFTISNYSVPNTSLLLKIEAFHDKHEKLRNQEKKDLDSFLCLIKENFQMQFPYIKPTPWFGYAEYNRLAIDNLPGRALFRKYPELFSIGQIITLSFVGFLFIYIILGRYSKSDSYSKVSRLNQK